MKKISKDSLDVKNLFKQYSTDSEVIDLDSMNKAYTDYKAKFIMSSKDKAMSLLNNIADEDNMASEDKIKEVLGHGFASKFLEEFNPVDKNGVKYYHMTDLM